MTTIEITKYQNDYTGEMFDDYDECFNSEAEFMFSKDSSGIIAVFDGGKIGNITEVFDDSSFSGLDADRINAIIFPSAESAVNFINNFKRYWYEIDGSQPEPFNPGICKDADPNTFIFIPSIDTEGRDHHSFISVVEAELIIKSFRADIKFAENAKKGVDNAAKV